MPLNEYLKYNFLEDIWCITRWNTQLWLQVCPDTAV